MEKEALIFQVSQRAGVSEEEVIKIFDAFISSIKESLKKGEKITITGFGTFSLAKRKAQKFLNPKNNQAYEIPERLHPHFKAGRNLQNTISKTWNDSKRRGNVH